jgi:hypothetical protein
MRAYWVAASILLSSPAAAELYLVKTAPDAQFRSDIARVSISGSTRVKAPSDEVKVAALLIDCAAGKLKVVLGGNQLSGAKETTGIVSVTGKSKTASVVAQLVSDRGRSILLMTLDKPDQIQSLYTAMVDQADNQSKVQLDFIDVAKPDDQKPEVFYFWFNADGDEGYAALFAKQLDVVRGRCVR